MRDGGEMRLAPKRLAVRFLLVAGLWAVLSGGAPSSWIVGIPVVILTVLVSVRVGVPLRLPRLRGLFHFVVMFVRESFRAGFAAAKVALTPQLRLRSGWLRHRWRVQDPSARVAVANLASLLPGTISADVSDHGLVLHVLDLNASAYPGLLKLEEHVADLFGIEVGEPEAAGD